jgi:hypothetical protein
VPNVEYFIGNGAYPFDAIVSFLIDTDPIEHSLCGDLKVTIVFDNQPSDGSVLNYSEVNNEFTVDTSEESLIG